MYGFYSKEQAQLYGFATYLDENEIVVYVTDINIEQNYKSSYENVICVGKLKRFIKLESLGTQNQATNLNDIIANWNKIQPWIGLR